MSDTNLGILGLEAIVTYVPYLERSRRFYVDRLDFAQVGQSESGMGVRGRQSTAVYRSGACTVVASAPQGPGGRAWRWLQRHPAGVGGLVIAVRDAQHAFDELEARGATPIEEISTHHDEWGMLKMFSITTPFGGATMRFVERRGYRALYPGFVASGPQAHTSRYGINSFDHVTSNFETMSPALLWMEHVLGLERYWDVEFHTDDLAGPQSHGSGLRSVVMWDRESGIKFANNEPWRPHFKQSQINIFAEENKGDGIQHVAFAVDDILQAVRGLRARNVEFLPTPDAYYQALPARIKAVGIGQIEEDIAELQSLGVLVDGDQHAEYLLQVFMTEASRTHDDPQAGPFFYELIQRKGNRGFGEGNFRALFESIERTQQDQAVS